MNYIIDVLYKFVSSIGGYVYKHDLTFNNPFSKFKDKKLKKFIGNDKKFNQVIFALNNTPNIIHENLFSKNIEICPKYFQITLKWNYGGYNYKSDNLDDLNYFIENESIRYIFIRVNLIETIRDINHVNCIIIDKFEKYVLFFEPLVDIKYNLSSLKKITENKNLSDYKYLIPDDIGYNSLNKLQKMDYFCQTYILTVFLLIVNNNHINYSDFSTLFNELIDFNNMELFWYNCQKILKKKGYNFDGVPLKWTYPTNTIIDIFNFIRINFLSNNQDLEKYNNKDIITKEEDDLIIFERIKNLDNSDVQLYL